MSQKAVTVSTACGDHGKDGPKALSHLNTLHHHRSLRGSYLSNTYPRRFKQRLYLIYYPLPLISFNVRCKIHYIRNSTSLFVCTHFKMFPFIFKREHKIKGAILTKPTTFQVALGLFTPCSAFCLVNVNPCQAVLREYSVCSEHQQRTPPPRLALPCASTTTLIVVKKCI